MSGKQVYQGPHGIEEALAPNFMILMCGKSIRKS
jgi:hypothetical protein